MVTRSGYRFGVAVFGIALRSGLAAGGSAEPPQSDAGELDLPARLERIA